MLNQDQRDVADKFFDFMLSPEKEFCLFGSGGTGKTYLIKYLMTEGKKKYEESCKLFGIPNMYYQYTLTATTNKAVQVLHHYSGIDAETIYSLFKIIVKDNYNTGETELCPNDPNYVVSNAVIFIDECSMLGYAMLKWIRTHSPDCKLVFIGDPYQLAPVKEKSYWSLVKSKTVGILTQQMRSCIPQLQNLAEQMKDYVRNKQEWNIQTHAGIIEHLDDQEMQKKLDEHFVANSKDSKILAFTNSKCLQYIDWINKQQGRTAPYMVGDRMVNTSNVEFTNRKRLYPDQEVFLERITKSFTNNTFGTPVVMFKGDVRTLGGRLYTDVPIVYDPEALKQALKILAKRKDWICYFGLKNTTLDLRPANALTIHKAQGSSYDTVFIDLDSFKHCRSYDMAARLMYVAVSRARKHVYFYGSLPKRLGRIL